MAERCSGLEFRGTCGLSPLMTTKKWVEDVWGMYWMIQEFNLPLSGRDFKVAALLKYSTERLNNPNITDGGTYNVVLSYPDSTDMNKFPGRIFMRSVKSPSTPFIGCCRLTNRPEIMLVHTFTSNKVEYIWMLCNLAVVFLISFHMR